MNGIKKGCVLVLAIICWSCLTLQAAPQIVIKLRVYEGSRVGPLAPPEFVASSYLQPTISANMRTDLSLDKEKNQIKRVFNLQDLNLLTEADMIIGEGGQAPDRARYAFRLNGGAYTVHVILLDLKPDARYLVGFYEMADNIPKNILNTEMSLMRGHSAVFGFENRQGKPYFCSFHITGPPDKIAPPPPPPPPPPPVPDALKKEIEVFEKGAVKITFESMPPRLLKLVEPVYPEEAKKSIQAGSVSLNVRIDVQGNVKQAMVVHASHEIFKEPAMQAVRQWKYEPYLKDGQPQEAVFSVNLRFQIK